MKITRFVISRPPKRSGLNYQIRFRSKTAESASESQFDLVAKGAQNLVTFTRGSTYPRDHMIERGGPSHPQS
jgi:hypothetical protein